MRRPFETGGYVFLQWSIPLLPRKAVTALSSLVGNVAVLFPFRERTIGYKNLDAVLGDTKTKNEKRKILAQSFRSFTLTMLDLFWFSKYTKQRIEKWVAIDPDVDVVFEDKAYIIISAHFGNWEMIAQANALNGLKLASIAATVKNNQVNIILSQLRQKTGQTIIPQKGALRTLIARLRKKYAVGFVLDQNTGVEQGGVSVDFLGLPMFVSSAPAALAYRTETDLIFLFCQPNKDGTYRIYTTGMIRPVPYDAQNDTKEVVLKLTQQIVDYTSSEILKHPEFWLWSYKHWRRLSNETYPANYPDY